MSESKQGGGPEKARPVAVSPEKLHLARCDPWPLRPLLSHGPHHTICGFLTETRSAQSYSEVPKFNCSFAAGFAG